MAELDQICALEYRKRSELIREAHRQYFGTGNGRLKGPCPNSHRILKNAKKSLVAGCANSSKINFETLLNIGIPNTAPTIRRWHGLQANLLPRSMAQSSVVEQKGLSLSALTENFSVFFDILSLKMLVDSNGHFIPFE